METESGAIPRIEFWYLWGDGVRLETGCAIFGSHFEFLDKKQSGNLAGVT